MQLYEGEEISTYLQERRRPRAVFFGLLDLALIGFIFIFFFR